jgi:hypothetical protein
MWSRSGWIARTADVIARVRIQNAPRAVTRSRPEKLVRDSGIDDIREVVLQGLQPSATLCANIR